MLLEGDLFVQKPYGVINIDKDGLTTFGTNFLIKDENVKAKMRFTDKYTKRIYNYRINLSGRFNDSNIIEIDDIYIKRTDQIPL